MKLCTIVAACRTKNKEKLQSMKDYAEAYLGGANNVMLCPYEPFEMSSTEIRENLKMRNGAGLSPKVYDYIVSRGLYI